MSEPSRFPGVVACILVLAIVGVCLLAMRAARSYAEADIDRDVHP